MLQTIIAITWQTKERYLVYKVEWNWKTAKWLIRTFADQSTSYLVCGRHCHKYSLGGRRSSVKHYTLNILYMKKPKNSPFKIIMNHFMKVTNEVVTEKYRRNIYETHLTYFYLCNSEWRILKAPVGRGHSIIFSKVNNH